MSNTCTRCGAQVPYWTFHMCRQEPTPASTNYIPRASGFDAPPPITEERVRQIVREELEKGGAK